MKRDLKLIVIMILYKTTSAAKIKVPTSRLTPYTFDPAVGKPIQGLALLATGTISEKPKLDGIAAVLTGDKLFVTVVMMVMSL